MDEQEERLDLLVRRVDGILERLGGLAERDRLQARCEELWIERTKLRGEVARLQALAEQRHSEIVRLGSLIEVERAQNREWRRQRPPSQAQREAEERAIWGEEPPCPGREQP